MKTTAKHFAYFKERCIFWADKFGLDEWDIKYFHENADSDRHSLATTHRFYLDCTAGIYLSTEWNNRNPINETSLDETACHEMTHLLLGNFALLGYSRFASRDELDKAEEALVVKLCKLL